MAKGPKFNIDEILANIEEFVDREIDKSSSTTRIQVELARRFVEYRNNGELKQQLIAKYQKAGWKSVSFNVGDADYRDPAFFIIILES